MSATDLIGRSFGQADYGVSWALFQLPNGNVRNGRFHTGDMEVQLSEHKAAKGEDDYAIRFTKTAVAVMANTAVGAISALLRLEQILASGKKANVTQDLRFRTRNYKHEIRFKLDDPRCVAHYTDEVWETLCRGAVANQFNGLVLYAGHHPFEHILDYKDCVEAATRPAADRAAIRNSLNRGLAIAHRYGLKTFIQHYVGHFTQPLADAYQIPTTGLLSAVDHPAVERYVRYCYRELFNQLPDLDGMYFNFESYPNGWKHVLATAITEFNRMKTKPIMVYRLWGFYDAEGMRTLIKSYRGRVILGHKISDTNDVYYLPVADSRVREWKKILGKDTEWMFLVGPCHNCGTNLCQQLWSDYQFVQDLLADAQAKGADSISFHTISDFFAPDAPEAAKVFTQHELNMARMNYLHVRAVIDYVNGRKLDKAARGKVLSERLGMNPRASAALIDAIEASSQPVLLAFQQFCYGSALEGYQCKPRRSHIQDPFLFYPANGMNDQAKGLLWGVGRTVTSWLDKTMNTTVAPAGDYQFVVDSVDPSKKKARLGPARMARLLKQHVDKSLRSIAACKKQGGGDAAATVETFIRHNADMGNFFRHELLAGVALCSVYFAKSKAAVVSALKKGIAELETCQPLISEKTSPSVKSMERVLMLDGLNVDGLIATAREALQLVQKADFPMPAYQDYLASRRQFNEIRRFIAPMRRHGEKSVKFIRSQLKAAIASADAAIKKLGGRHDGLASNVQAWKEFLADEVSQTHRPELSCGKTPNGFIPLQFDECFRLGENFIEDFCGFFRKYDYIRPAGISFQVWRAGDELVVALRETGVDVQQRMAQWDKYKTEGSNSHIMRISFDTPEAGRRDFIVWPMGSSVNEGNTPHVPVRTEFASDSSTWTTTAYFPMKMLARRKPKKGEVWGLNVTSNPAVIRNFCYSWSPQYDGAGNTLLYGKMKFE